MASLPGVNGGSFLNRIPGPEAGQFVTGASVQQVAQGAANQDKYLADGLCVTKTPAFYWDGSYTNEFKPTINAGSSASIKFGPQFPHGIKVRTFVVKLSPGAHGALPSSMPQLVFFRVTLAGVLDQSWSVTDTTSPVASYVIAHDLTIDLGANITIDRETYLYMLQFVQETGADSANGAIGPARIALL